MLTAVRSGTWISLAFWQLPPEARHVGVDYHPDPDRLDGALAQNLRARRIRLRCEDERWRECERVEWELLRARLAEGVSGSFCAACERGKGGGGTWALGRLARKRRYGCHGCLFDAVEVGLHNAGVLCVKAASLLVWIAMPALPWLWLVAVKREEGFEDWGPALGGGVMDGPRRKGWWR
jgi:hypothetical protein